jgi:hypothetical protein
MMFHRPPLSANGHLVSFFQKEERRRQKSKPTLQRIASAHNLVPFQILYLQLIQTKTNL